MSKDMALQIPLVLAGTIKKINGLPVWTKTSPGRSGILNINRKIDWR